MRFLLMRARRGRYALSAVFGTLPDTAHLYAVQDKANAYSASDIQALKYLGPTFVDQGVNFGVYSARATHIDLLFFDDLVSEKPARTIPLTQFGNVWNAYVEGVGVGPVLRFPRGVGAQLGAGPRLEYTLGPSPASRPTWTRRATASTPTSS